MKTWGGIVDNLINNITFETRDVHLRQAGRGRHGEPAMVLCCYFALLCAAVSLVIFLLGEGGEGVCMVDDAPLCG